MTTQSLDEEKAWALTLEKYPDGDSRAGLRNLHAEGYLAGLRESNKEIESLKDYCKTLVQCCLNMGIYPPRPRPSDLKGWCEELYEKTMSSGKPRVEKLTEITQLRQLCEADNLALKKSWAEIGKLRELLKRAIDMMEHALFLNYFNPGGSTEGEFKEIIAAYKLLVGEKK